MSEQDDKIVRPNFGDPKMTVDRTEPYCSHKFIAVRARSRTVWCRMCKREIDPFDVVLDVAGDWDMATWREREMRELADRVEQLKTEETNTKSRIRTARKQGEQPVGKVELYFAEWLRRLNAADDMGTVYEADRWAESFNWLTPEMSQQVNDARFRAKQRAEASARRSTRNRGVRVIKGGSST